MHEGQGELIKRTEQADSTHVGLPLIAFKRTLS